MTQTAYFIAGSVLGFCFAFLYAARIVVKMSELARQNFAICKRNMLANQQLRKATGQALQDHLRKCPKNKA